LQKTICHEGYLTPLNQQQIHCMGATFERHANNEQFQQIDQNANKEKLQKCIGNKSWIEAINSSHMSAHVGVRCTTRDHFPYMGHLLIIAPPKIVMIHNTRISIITIICLF